MLNKVESLHTGHVGGDTSLELHDPLTIWYVLTRTDPRWETSSASPEDIRVETAGQWTRGMTVLDRRDRQRRDSDGEAPHDRGNWLGKKSGNRIRRMVRSGSEETFGEIMLDRILGRKVG